MSPADQISLYFPSITIFRFFWPKGGRSSAFISLNVGRSGVGAQEVWNPSNCHDRVMLPEVPSGLPCGWSEGVRQ